MQRAVNNVGAEMKDDIWIDQVSLQQAMEVLEPPLQLDLPLNTLKVFIIIKLAQAKSWVEHIIGPFFSV